MWRVTHRSSENLSYLSRESWFGQAFWSIFLFAGLAILFGLFFIGIPHVFRNPPEVFWHYFVLLLPLIVGGGFTWVGAWGVAGRQGIDFDLAAERVTVWTGYFRPIWKTTYDLKSFRRVMIEPAVQRGGAKTRHWEYPVAVTGPDGVRVEMELMTPEQATAFGRQIASFLGLELEGPGPRVP
jgi:hypothetical protein